MYKIESFNINKSSLGTADAGIDSILSQLKKQSKIFKVSKTIFEIFAKYLKSSEEKGGLKTIAAQKLEDFNKLSELELESKAMFLNKELAEIWLYKAYADSTFLASVYNQDLNTTADKNTINVPVLDVVKNEIGDYFKINDKTYCTYYKNATANNADGSIEIKYKGDVFFYTRDVNFKTRDVITGVKKKSNHK